MFNSISHPVKTSGGELKTMVTIWQRKWHAVYWTTLSGCLWYLLSGGKDWGIGIVLIVLTTTTALYVRSTPWHIQLRRLPAFLLFFVAKLATAGFDVAYQACRPRPSLRPGWVRFPLREPDARVSLILSAMVGLLPGTLASRIDGGELHIHVLNLNTPWHPTVARLEEQLAQLLVKASP